MTIVAEGPVRRPIVEEGPAFSFDVTAQVAGLTLAGTITKVPEGIYLIVGDRPFRLPLSAEEAKAVRIPPEPALFVSEPVEVGREEIGGVPTVHLQGRVATDAVVDYLAELLSGAPGLLAGGEPPDATRTQAIKDELRAAVRESRSEVWIGTNDLLPHRVAALLILEGPIELLPGVASARLEIRADVGGFDEEAEIAAPVSAEPFSLRSLGLPGL